VKITKDNIASRYLAARFTGSPSSRNEYIEPEPVHTIIADRNAMAREHATGKQESRQAAPACAPRGDGERRKRERRQRQRDVLLDTRATPSRRQNQSIDEEA
jgi:hypothetical protein